MFSSTWRQWIRGSAGAASGNRRRRPARKSSRRLDLEHLEDRCLLAASLGGLSNYGQVPLSFEANQGQTDPQVSFLSHGSGYALFLTSTEAVLRLQQPPASSGALTAGSDVIRMQLLNSNPVPQVQGLNEQATTSNYFIGSDPSQWRTGIANFGKVTYQNVYSGIDLAYYGNQRQLEYDFIVSPGANPGAIAFSFQGTTSLSADAQGNLVLHTPGGDVVEHAPVVYQDGPAGRESVSGQYVLGGNGQVGFAVGAYDPSRTLVIDPVLSYSTYLGGSGSDKGSGIAVDSFGNAYVVGTSNSIDFPLVNTPPLQPAIGGGFDIFIAKVNSSGSGLVYSTYLGGSGDDVGTGIAVDASGTVTFVGYSNSVNYPVVAAVQGAFAGGHADAVVGKLSPTGTALTFNTYLGGNSDDFGLGIALDAAGNSYVTGGTASTNAFLTSPAPAGPLTYRNAFKSTDSGNTWGTSNSGILDASVVAWTFDPTTPGTLFAATNGTGVYRSTNSGVSWTQVNGGLTNLIVISLASDAAGNVYAGTVGGGVFRLAKSATTWTPASAGLTNLTVQALAVSPSGTLYAGTAAGMFSSTNGGTSWTPRNTGFTNINVPVPDITAIVTDPDPNHVNDVYAGTAGGGVFKSTDAGTTWTPMVNGLSNFNVAALAIFPPPPGSPPGTRSTLYAATHGDGVFKSTNGGASWTSFSAGLRIIDPNFFETNTTAVAVDSTGTPYVGTDAGVFKYNAARNSWELSNANLTNLSVTALAVDPLNATTLFAGSKVTEVAFAAKLTSAGALTYSDHFGGSLDQQGHGIVVDAAGNAFVTGYTTSTDFPVTPATAFQRNNGDQKSFRTADGGATWTPNDANGLPRGSLLALAVNPAAPATVYAGLAGSGVFKTMTSGATWTASNFGLTNLTVHVLAVEPTTQNVFVGTDNGVQFSINGGATWTATNLTGVTVTSFAIASPSVMYAGTTGGGVFKSTTGGTSWTAVINGLTNLNVTGVAVDPVFLSTVLVGTAGAGVFRTVNAGGFWAADNAGLPGANGSNPVIYITAVAFTPNGIPYLGVNNGNAGLGVFTPDVDGNWAPVNAGLKDLNVTYLAPDPTNSSVLYVGTRNGGIFTTTDGGIGWSQDNGSAALNGNNRLTDFQVAVIAIDPTNPQIIYAGFIQSLTPTADVFLTELNPAGSAIAYATYLGGNGDDVGQGIALDRFGLVYLTGYTSSGAFPLVHPLVNQSVIHPAGTFHYDAFVTKINVGNSTLIYSTFLGGGSATPPLNTRNPEGDDYGNAIAVDSDGSAVVVGGTTALDFPTTDTAFQTGLGGGVNQGDAFVTRLPADLSFDFTGIFPNGDTEIFSSYLGGNGDDSAYGVALDQSGNIYVTGFTGSGNFPTVTPAQAALGGPTTGAIFTDAFVSKIIPIPTTVTLTVQTSPSVFGGQLVDVTLTAFHHSASNAPFGTAFTFDTFFDGPVELGHDASDAKGNAVITIRGVSLTTAHSFYVYFGGDKNHMPSKSLPVTLVPTVTQLTSTGAGGSFTATVVPTTGGGVPTGYVTFMVNFTVLPGQPGINPPVPGNPNVPGPDQGDGTVVQFGVPLTNGTATYAPPIPFTPGTYTITAVYSGDLVFAPSTSAPLSQAIPQAATATSLTAAPASSVFGQPVSFTATVVSLTPNSGVPSGNVRFDDSGIVLGTVALGANGVATFTTTSPLSVGTHSITAFYLGSANFATSSSAVLSYTVAKAATTTALAATPTPPVTGQPLTLTATVTVLTPGAGAPTGSVTFMDGQATLGAAVVAPNGTASFTISSLTAGAHQFVAIYSGDNNFNGSTSPPLSLGPTVTTLTVSSTRPAVGQLVTFTATVAPQPPASGNPTGTVTFFDNGVPLTTVPVNGGQAVFQTAALTAGSHNISATYNGDNFFTPSSSAVVNVFVASPVSATFTSSPNPSGVGQAVTISMTVTGTPGGPVPTGTVQFVIDSVNQGGPVPLNGAGTATISTSALAFGTHTLTANYSGDATYAAVAAGPITQVVQFLASVSLASSVNPSALGAAVTFTATVAAVPPATGTPTGTVTFMDGTTALATVPLGSNGVASFTTRKLTAGNHKITAVYSGDSNFAPNTSAVLLQGVSLNAIFVTGADAGGGPNVLVFDSVSGSVKFNFFAYDPGFTGGVRVAVGDTNGDGFPDVITAPGPGGGPDIHVYDGKTGNLIRRFFAYNPLFTGGQYLSSADLNGDGFADIIVGADKGGGPNVITFSGKDGSVMYNFMAYDIGFTGGVRVAGGDVNGDGFGDIITGPGPGGGPNVKVFNGANGALMSSFSAFNPFEAHGLFLAAGDTNGDGRDEIIVSLDAGIGPTVGVYDGLMGVQLQAFFAYDPNFTGGVRVGIRPNKSGTTDILTVAGPGGGADVKTFSGANDQLIDEFFAYNPLFTGGLFVAGGR